MYEYYGCCVNLKADEVNFLKDHSIQISYKTFLKHIGREPIKELNLAYGVPLHKDWHVSFHRSKFEDGTRAYYYTHSAIENIYKEIKEEPSPSEEVLDLKNMIEEMDDLFFHVWRADNYREINKQHGMTFDMHLEDGEVIGVKILQEKSGNYQIIVGDSERRNIMKERLIKTLNSLLRKETR